MVRVGRKLGQDMLSDLRRAALRLLATPVASAIAIGCLALGLAAAIMVYSVIAQVVLRPSAIANADAVRLLELELRAGAQTQRVSNWSYPAFEALRDALAPDFTAATALAGDTDALLDHLDGLLTWDRMSDSTRATVKTAVNAQTTAMAKVKTAVHLISESPDFVVLK